MIILYCETAIYKFTVHLQPLQSALMLKKGTVNTVNEFSGFSKIFMFDFQAITIFIYSLYSIYSVPGDSQLHEKFIFFVCHSKNEK